MIDTIVEFTNANIDKLLLRYKLQHLGDNHSFLRKTYTKEIYALIGLMYYRSLYSVNNPHIDTLISDAQGLSMFGAIMSQSRFKIIMANLSFDDIETRDEWWQSNRLAFFRDFFENFNDNCARHVTPEEYLSLDETLYLMRHQIAFRQHNVNKPAKYGVLFKSTNAAGYPYLFRNVVYAGKLQAGEGKYYLKGTDSYKKSLVEKQIVLLV